MSYVSRLNQTFGLQLELHDINHMYSLCGKKISNYYLKVRDMRVQLISCLLDSNRNYAGEYIQVRGKWFAGDVPPPPSQCEVGSFRSIVYSPFSFNNCFIYPNINSFLPFLLQTVQCSLQTLGRFMCGT